MKKGSGKKKRKTRKKRPQRVNPTRPRRLKNVFFDGNVMRNREAIEAKKTILSTRGKTNAKMKKNEKFKTMNKNEEKKKCGRREPSESNCQWGYALAQKKTKRHITLPRRLKIFEKKKKVYRNREAFGAKKKPILSTREKDKLKNDKIKKN